MKNLRIFELLFLSVMIVSLSSCASNTTLAELKSSKTLISYYSYLGSDQDFDYIRLNDLFSDRVWRVRKGEIIVDDEIEYKPNRKVGGKVFYYFSSDGRMMDVPPISLQERE